MTALAITLAVLAQLGTPAPLADLAAGTQGVYVNSAMAVDGGYLVAVSSAEGVEPWFVSGSGPSMAMIRDVNPGVGAGLGVSIGVLGGQAVFMGDDGLRGSEPWVTDGTLAGTHLLADLTPGPVATRLVASAAVAQPPGAAPVLVFFACPPSTGCEPWVTDGTSAGTRLLKDLTPGPASSNPTNPVAVGAEVWWVEGSRTVWKSDGTEAGTSMVYRAPTALPSLRGLAVVGRKVFLVGFAQVWVIDLTQPSPVPQVAFNVPYGSLFHFTSSSRALEVTGQYCDYTGCTLSTLATTGGPAVPVPSGTGVSWNDRLFVFAGPVFELGAADAGLADAGVVQIAAAATQPSMVGRERIGGVSFLFDGVTFSPSPAVGQTPIATNGNTVLYLSGGTTVTVVDLADGGSSSTLPALLDGRSSIPGPFVAAGSSVVFVASDDTFGREPFAVSSDAGLVLLDDTLAGSSGSNASVFAGPGFAGILTAISGASRLTQGTPQTTSTLAGVDRYFGPSSGIIGDRLYLVPQGAPNGLWSVDVNGRVVGLPLVLAPLAGLTTAANGLFFTARSPVSGLELWFTDGSSVGTVELDLSPGLASSAPEQLTRYKQGVAFSALDGAGRELWWSNGTRDTTARLADLAPGPFSGRPQSMVALGDRLAFFADDGVHGLEPWLWDGTAAQQITELVPGDAGVVPLRSIALGRRAISVVSFPDGSQHLIRSDGTAAGTAELGPLSGNTWLQAVGGTLFFDNATPETGVELWAWWPTLAAPMRLTDSAPGPRSSMPGPGAAAGTLYVFAGLDLDGGREPWGVTVDVTPPVVTPQVTGPLGPNGVYTGDVTVHFALGDPESAVSSEGCADVTVSADTAGLTLHCVADSAGGTGEGSVTVRRDTTAPVLTCPPSAVFSQGALALEVSALDAQDPAPALVYQPALADVTPLTEQVHVVASDATGNSSSCEVVVQVPGAPPRKDPLTSCGCGGTGDAALEGALLVALLVLRRRRQSGVRVKT